MRIAEFIGATVYVGFLLIFLSIVVRAIREPRRATFDATLFFGAIGLLALIGLVFGPSNNGGHALLDEVRRMIGLALPLLLLRVLDGFTPVPARLNTVVTVGYPITVASLLLPDVYGVMVIPTIYFIATLAICSVIFVRYAPKSTGVTRRRMQAIGAGTAALMLTGCVAVIGRQFPEHQTLWQVATSIGAVGTMLGYLLGVAPPASVHRLWQYSALTSVLRLLATTPASLPLPESIPLLNQGIAEAFGVPGVAILVWDEEQQALIAPGQQISEYPDYHPNEALVTRVFRSQRARFFADALGADPLNSPLYERFNSRSMLAAPIRTATKQVGVFTLFSPRASVFSSDDLPLAETVAEQVAAFFVRSELVHQAVTVEAQAEAAQLKEDFLAAAAHDLRTPLTGILGHAQLLLRRAEREPDAAPQRLSDLRSLVADSKRMQRLTEGLLEVSRSDQGRFSGDLVLTDLRPLVLTAVAAAQHGGHAIHVEGTARAYVDAERFGQVIQNLVDNAVKFTPGGGEIQVTLVETAELTRLTVDDSGLGLSHDDIEGVFERFQHGSAATRGRIAGMSVGLYLCRRIVEEHDGTIRAEQRPEGGSRFIVELPLVESVAMTFELSPADAPPLQPENGDLRGHATPRLVPTS